MQAIRELNLRQAITIQSLVRVVFVAGYVGTVVLCFLSPVGPRVFWTMVLPLLPLGIVLAGFYAWRSVCPLAFWGSLGVVSKSKTIKQRRVPVWMEQWFFLITAGFLTLMLVVRLVLINGDGPLLGATLIGVGFLAAFTNFAFTGKTWCNFICPVGFVERVYTDPNSLRGSTNSQCAKCTACKKNCPDIDQENAYWKDVEDRSRRISFYSFPGVVLGFYTYYFLRYGDWEAYFDGRWTRQPASLEFAFGPGFYFAPAVPALLAATLTLVGYGAVSFLIFAVIERVLSRFMPDAEARRHWVLTLTGFAAFNLFYYFAGAPTLRQIPGGTRLLAFIVPVVSMLFLIKRLQREHNHYVQEKSVKKILAKWPFPQQPPRNPGEVIAFFQAHEQGREAQIIAYKELIREILADGTVMSKDVRLLDKLRADLRITEAEHKKIFEQLSQEDRDLFDPQHVVSVEQRLQTQGYQVALSAALLRHASAKDIESLRTEFGISPELHEELVTELRGAASPLLARMQERFETITRLRAKLLALSPMAYTLSSIDFLIYVLLKTQDRAADDILRVLGLMTNHENSYLIPRLFAEDKAARVEALNELRAKSNLHQIVDQLEPIMMMRMPRATDVDWNLFNTTLAALATDSNPYLRAGAVLALGQMESEDHQPSLEKALQDESPIVREAAVRSALRVPNAAERDSIALLATDPDVRVSAAAKQALHALTQDQADLVQLALVQPVNTPLVTGRYNSLPLPDERFSTLSTIEKILFLHNMPLFLEFDAEELHQIADLTDELTIAAPDPLCVQGDLSTDVYIITYGEAEVLIEQEGQTYKIAEQFPGDVVGELAALDNSPRSATVRTITPTLRVLRLNGTTFRNRLINEPDIAPKIMAILSRRLRETLDQLRASS